AGCAAPAPRGASRSRTSRSYRRGKIPRTLDHSFPEPETAQMLLEEHQKLAPAFDQIQIQRDESLSPRRVVEQDQSIAADHLLRSADPIPGNHPAAEMMERSDGDALFADLGDRTQRSKPHLEPAQPQGSDVQPDEFLAD